MKNTALIAYIAATAAVVSATDGGVIINPDGTYTCPTANAAYCAGDSLKTDIIIRCYGTRGQPGRCSDNLAGEPPVGVTPALCYQSSSTAGDASCEKNCVVYGGSGNGKGTFTLPAEICTPTYTATSSVAPSTTATSKTVYSTIVSSSTTPSGYPVESSSSSYPVPSSYPVHSSKTYSPKPPHSYPTSKEDYTTETSTSYSTFITTTGYPTSVPTVPTSAIYPTQNNTIVTTKPTQSNYPTGPSTTASTTPPPVPAGAVHNSAAGGALALVGLVAAYIL